MFNIEIKKGEETKAWLYGMNKYFHNYNFSGELKAKLDICDLRGKTDIRWYDINKVKGIKECYVTCKTFKKNFKQKYISEQYYEEKPKEFTS